MSRRFPLPLKFALGLALNLLLVAGLGLAVLLRGGIDGWLARPVGDRLQVIAENIASDFNTASAEQREALLERYGDTYDLTFLIFENTGEQRGGEIRDLPAEVAERMNPRGRGRNAALRAMPPLRAEGARDAMINGPQGSRRAGTDGRIVIHTNEPATWWFGVRVPVTAQAGASPSPGTLFAVGPSVWRFGRLIELWPALAAVVIALVVSVVFWAPFIISLTRALRRMSEATERVAAGDFSVRVPEGRADEIGALGASVNRMSVRLDSLVNGQRRFLGDVAHELGGPLARLQFGTSILDERVAPELRPAVADVREEIDHMGALVGELLAFTKAGMQRVESIRERVDLQIVVAATIAREAPAGRVVVSMVEGALVWADPALLARALGNLVRNALRHAGEATIEVRVTVNSETVCLAVIDDGPGVPAEALARLGEPFYRPDEARTQESGGVGLGLAIVKSAAQACGGSVDFRNRKSGGFIAEMTLRRAI